MPPERNFTDADLEALSAIFAKAHPCPFTPDRARTLNDLADTAQLVSRTGITSIVKGAFYVMGLVMAMGLLYWGKKLLGG